MSVIEYETHFASFSRYALEMVAIEELRARKFQDGLHLDIRPRISVLELRTYEEVVQKAMLVEVEDRDQLRIKGSYKQSRGEASSVSIWGQWKKAKAEDSSRSQVVPAQSAVVQSGFRVPQVPQSAALPVGSYPVTGPTPTASGHQSGHQGSSQQSEAQGRAYALPQADTSAGTSTVRVTQRDGFLCVDTPVGGPMFLDRVCQGCAIKIAGQTLKFDFVVFNMTGFDVILGMDWLSFFRAIIDYFR
ncbi:uncharacterized protein LOC132296554 [Cornus florida]|uniref:uncharacterized protein LOC132296554 n=1 Tax=Cornus florida TaxID=4283 RepID=UPI002899DB94|nr:uncharacterized protein LOC132296554 [Cornus florida]